MPCHIDQKEKGKDPINKIKNERGEIIKQNSRNTNYSKRIL